MAIKNNASAGTLKAIGQKRRKTRENIKRRRRRFLNEDLQSVVLNFTNYCNWHFIWPFGICRSLKFEYGTFGCRTTKLPSEKRRHLPVFSISSL
jgi:hypothetical protein